MLLLWKNPLNLKIIWMFFSKYIALSTSRWCFVFLFGCACFNIKQLSGLKDDGLDKPKAHIDAKKGTMRICWEMRCWLEWLAGQSGGGGISRGVGQEDVAEIHVSVSTNSSTYPQDTYDSLRSERQPLIPHSSRPVPSESVTWCNPYFSWNAVPGTPFPFLTLIPIIYRFLEFSCISSCATLILWSFYIRVNEQHQTLR